MNEIILHCDMEGCPYTTTWEDILDDPVGQIICNYHKKERRMSLFECEACGVVENTACCNYHWRKMKSQPLLCSQCDPDIKKWHDVFERVNVKDTEYEVVPEGGMFPGTLQPPGGWK